MPLITLSEQEYANEARALADQLKCRSKGDERMNRFVMNDIQRLDLYTELGLMRQIDSLRGIIREPFCLDSQVCKVSGDPNNKIEIHGDSRRILNDDFIGSVRHYFQGRVSVEASDSNGIIESSSSVLSSNFLRVVLSDLADLSVLNNVGIVTSKDVFACVKNRRKTVVLNDNAIKSLLGYDFSHEQIIEALHFFGYNINNEISGEMLVEIPFHRVDIASESDIIEDIMLYYLQLFKGDFPVQVHNSGACDNKLLEEQTTRARFVDGLVSFGFKEVKTPVLRKTPNCRIYKLREDLLASFLSYEQKRQHLAQPHCVFELGHVKNGDKLSNHLGLGIVGNNIDFNYLFSIVHHLLSNITKLTISLKPTDSDRYENGGSFVILNNDEVIGEIGIVSTKKMPGGKLKHQCMYAELYLPSFI